MKILQKCLLSVGVKIFIILNISINSISCSDYSLESFDIEKDSSWFVHNLKLFKADEDEVWIYFHQNYDLSLKENGKVDCKSNPNKVLDYCRLSWAMEVAQRVSDSRKHLFEYIFNEKLYYSDIMQSIKNSIPSGAAEKFETIFKDDELYNFWLFRMYTKRYYTNIASFGMDKSYLFIDDKLNIKAYINMTSYVNNLPLPEDSQQYTQDECDNKFEYENIIKSCQVKKPTIEIFFEADNKDNVEIFNEELIQTITNDGILKYAEKIKFVPFGTTKFDEVSQTYVCNNIDQCHANMLYACFLDKMIKENSYSEPLFMRFFKCTSNSAEKPLEAIERCLNILYPDEASEIYLQINDCAREGEKTVLKEHEDLTKLRKVTKFPSIYLNGESMQIDNNKDINLIGNICKSIDGIKPRLCSDYMDNIGKITEKSPMKIDIYYNPGHDEIYKQILTKLNSSEDGENRYLLRNYLDINFIPWGSSQIINGSNVDCSTADKMPDCLISRITACAENVITAKYRGSRIERSRIGKYLYCFYSKDNWNEKPLSAAMDCADMLSDSDVYPWLMQCSKQDDKIGIWKDYGQQTNNVIGNIFDTDIRFSANGQLIDSNTDFINYTCKFKYQNDPIECPLSEVQSSANVIISTFLTFFISTFVILFY